MDKSDKQAMVEYLSTQFAKAQAAFLTDYRGLDVEKISDLRNRLGAQGSEYRVIKNTLAKIAAQGTIIENCKEQLQGPNAMALVFDDPAAAAKTLVEFAEKESKLEIKGGVLGGTVLSVADISHLASLPGREVLLAQVLGTMNAVPGGLVNVLSGVVRSLVQVLSAVQEAKEQA
ncbi:MAG: 50S ribosomal protein L10 [Deltaproteobacteria bacterium]|nr:50S ribosomal protein L10 [Candidatus Anaeroferrophillus wilburensis]MBN2888422.1 50S ribosomal protein L10 [Deltaproteobacteria bacterium]